MSTETLIQHDQVSTQRRSLITGAAALSLLAGVRPAVAVPSRRRGKMPVLFIGHGSPINAIRMGSFGQALQMRGKRLPRPKAILVVSAHWITESGTAVLNAASPETIHDFSGFPQALYDYTYPAPGAQEFAQVAVDLMAPYADLRSNWGLDHGTWTVLKYLFPEANIPVFQVSVDIYKPGPHHYALGASLAGLREQGVLIVGSGNIVHNLRRTERLDESSTASQVWAQAFDEQVRAALAQRDDRLLANYGEMNHADMAVPTPDHYYPLMYALGASREDGPPATIYHSFQSGTISMRCLQFGS